MFVGGNNRPDTTKLMIVSQNATLIWGIVSKIMGANFLQTFPKINIETKLCSLQIGVVCGVR